MLSKKFMALMTVIIQSVVTSQLAPGMALRKLIRSPIPAVSPATTACKRNFSQAGIGRRSSIKPMIARIVAMPPIMVNCGKTAVRPGRYSAKGKPSRRPKTPKTTSPMTKVSSQAATMPTPPRTGVAAAWFLCASCLGRSTQPSFGAKYRQAHVHSRQHHGNDPHQ